MSAPSTSRRQLLIAGAALAVGGGAAVAIASGGDGGGASKRKRVETVSPEQAMGDATALNTLLDLERAAIAGYGVAAGRLRGRDLETAREFEAHEREHAAALERTIRRLGGTPDPQRPAREYLATFPRLRSDRDALSFALDLETTAVAAYADAMPKIVTDGVRAALGAILVAEAQHQAVVLGALGRPQVPQPFVTGPPPEEDPDA